MFKLRIMPEVDQQGQPLSRCFEIVDRLGTMLIRQLLDGFDFHDDIAKTNKIRHIGLLQGLAFVIQLETGLFSKWNALTLEFQCQAFLIDPLQKPAALLLVHFDTGPHDLEALFFEQNGRIHFRVFRVFRC
jgi:hypothetical protein